MSAKALFGSCRKSSQIELGFPPAGPDALEKREDDVLAGFRLDGGDRHRDGLTL